MEILIDIEDVEGFLNKYVAVGVPHDLIYNRLFYYFGFLKSIENKEITIRTKNGFKIIPIENIKHIYETGGQQ